MPDETNGDRVPLLTSYNQEEETVKRAPASAWIGLALAQACTGSSPNPIPSSPPEVRISPSPQPVAPVVASVTCTESGMAASPFVRARVDGAEVLVRNFTEHDVSLAVGRITEGPKPQGEHGRLADGRWFESGMLASQGDNTVLPGTAEAQVWIVPPGAAGAACLSDQLWSWPLRFVPEFDSWIPPGSMSPRTSAARTPPRTRCSSERKSPMRPHRFVADSWDCERETRSRTPSIRSSDRPLSGWSGMAIRSRSGASISATAAA